MEWNVDCCLTKEQALEALKAGKKVCHRYYTPDEYIYMKDGIIWTEDGCECGTEFDEFWAKIQKWEDGWGVRD